MLVVHKWRATVQASSLHEAPGVDGAEKEVVEERGRGVRVGEAAGAVGQTLLGLQGGGGGAGFPEDHEGRMRRSGQGSPRGQGGGRGRRERRARPTLECTFPSSFHCSSFILVHNLRDEAAVSFVFPYRWLGARL